MTYQPVYGKVSDDFVERTTSSRNGKVHQIEFEGLTHFGKAIDVNVSSMGSLPKKDEQEAEQKILKWAEKENSKKCVEWGKKLKERKQYNIQQEKEERVDIDINISSNPKMRYTINGVEINKKILDMINNNKEIFNKIDIADTLKNE